LSHGVQRVATTQKHIYARAPASTAAIFCFDEDGEPVDFCVPDYVPTDTCQLVREEKTTPGGAHVALYPGWITYATPDLGLLDPTIFDPLACWDACVYANPLTAIIQVVTTQGLVPGCYCGESLDTISSVDDLIQYDGYPAGFFEFATTVFSCDAGSSGRKLETITRSGRSSWLKKQ